MIELEIHPNPDIVTYHTRKRLSDKYIMWVETHMLIKGEKIRSVVSDWLLALLKDLYEIDGVVDIDVDQYSLSLTKAKLFTWQELDVSVNAVLEKHDLQ